jgi:hypothetical protein
MNTSSSEAAFDPIDNLRDAIAYARAFGAGDVEGVKALRASADPALLLPALGMLVAASVRREAARRGVDGTVVWDELLWQQRSDIVRSRNPADR